MEKKIWKLPLWHLWIFFVVGFLPGIQRAFAFLLEGLHWRKGCQNVGHFVRYRTVWETGEADSIRLIHRGEMQISHQLFPLVLLALLSISKCLAEKVLLGIVLPLPSDTSLQKRKAQSKRRCSPNRLSLQTGAFSGLGKEELDFYVLL